MEDFFSGSANLNQGAKDYFNALFRGTEEHVLTHRFKYTVAIGNGKYKTICKDVVFDGLEVFAEKLKTEEKSDILDLYERLESGDICNTEDTDDEIVIIKCGCGEEWFINLSAFDGEFEDLSTLSYVEIIESFVEKINLKYNVRKEVVEKDRVVTDNPLFGLVP